MNRRRTACAAAAIVLLLQGMVGGAGHADPRDDKTHIDRQLQETEATLEAATERARQAAVEHAAAAAALPGAETTLADARGRVIGAEAAARQAQRNNDAAKATERAATGAYEAAAAEVARGRAEVSKFVAAAYKGSGFAMANSVLNSGSPSDLALRIAYLDHAAADQRRAVDRLTIARTEAKQRSDSARMAREQAQRTADIARRALEVTLTAQSDAAKAAGDVRALVDRAAKARAVAEQERTAVLARYKALKHESDRIGAELRAIAAAEARNRGNGSAAGSGPATAPRSGSFFVMPVRGWKSSNFGMRFDPYYKVWQLHAGVDLAAGSGQPIVSAGEGRVVRAGWAGGYGNYTCVSHGTYQGEGLATCYAHQSAILVSAGQSVGRGEVIGRVGTTGASTGYHLHFEVRRDGRPVQPLEWLPGCLC